MLSLVKQEYTEFEGGFVLYIKTFGKKITMLVFEEKKSSGDEPLISSTHLSTIKMNCMSILIGLF